MKTLSLGRKIGIGAGVLALLVAAFGTHWIMTTRQARERRDDDGFKDDEPWA
jgi:hypothetical protein